VAERKRLIAEYNRRFIPWIAAELGYLDSDRAWTRPAPSSPRMLRNEAPEPAPQSTAAPL
jgi:hypothetical protein